MHFTPIENFMTRKTASCVLLLTTTFGLAAAAGAQSALQPHTLNYLPGKSITLSLPPGMDINVAASGLRRVRFFAQAPDGRIFATGMYNLADNTQGAVFLLDGWDARTHTFAHVVRYLDHLRNPNNLAFYTEPARDGHAGQMWLYVPLTDRLLRYKYEAGDVAPTSPPEVLMHFQDYGLNYKYGGWHLTRTVAIATLHGRTRVYIAAGSSCDYCREREVIRASLSAMDPDGSHQQLLAHGLRNAVDLAYVDGLDGGALFATNMGDDHLGDTLPEDTFFELDANDHAGPVASTATPNYGWPTCYFAHGKAVLDKTPVPDMPALGDPRYTADGSGAVGAPQGALKTAIATAATVDPNANLGAAPAPLTTCKDVPAAYTTFAAHSSPLGLAYFAENNSTLHGSFLVALHGAGHPRIGTGYRLVRFSAGDRTPRDFLTGFLTVEDGKAIVHGRPCGLLRTGPDSFLLTDDFLGLIYFIHPSGGS
jgi:glucose/arabinose dehydrogenase